MTKPLNTDICIIGAGAAGLSVAAVAAQLDRSVVLIENHKMGGDCLNYGCVPSKALIAAGHVAETMRQATTFGIDKVEAHVDYAQVKAHVRHVQDQIAPNDSVERFTKLGVNVIQAEAKFMDKTRLQAGDKLIKAKYFVIATGSSAAIPPITGLDQVSYLTNETIFDLDKKPEHLIVIGGGPIGTELAQAHARLGTTVTQLVVGKLLPKDQADLVQVVRDELIANGTHVIEDIDNISQVEPSGDNIIVHYKLKNQTHSVTGSHLLVATGRSANVNGLNLEAAEVDYNPRGIITDKRLRSSNKHIYAIGDVAGPYQFTHMASYQAGIVIRNMLFKLPAKVDYRAVAWVTYTSPELAHVGMQPAEARAYDKQCRMIELPFTDNDRAQAERATAGKIQVITNRKGIVLGCDIVGNHAGELLLPWCMAVQHKLSIRKMADLIAPYPTLSELSKRVAGSYYQSTLFSNKTKWLVKWLDRLF
ncbi:MAG: FAD-dependent oxidoreductase [Pseudomonadota bacterium]